MKKRSKDLLFITALALCAHNASFFAALSQAANCQNGPDGLTELMWAGLFGFFAVIFGFACVYSNSSFLPRIERKIQKIIAALLCLLLVPAVIYAGFHIYVALFRPVVCAVGDPLISGPSCIDCWCHRESCGG